jgi:hypothetical protein
VPAQQGPGRLGEVAVAVVEREHDPAPRQGGAIRDRATPFLERGGLEARVAQVRQLLREGGRGDAVARGAGCPVGGDPVVHEDRQAVGDGHRLDRNMSM